MKPRTIISLLLGGALLVLCIAPQTPANSLNSNSIIKDNIEYYLQTDKAVYNTGEDVQMLYRVTNHGPDAVVIWFNCGPANDRCDFIVEKDGQSIWNNLSREATFAVTFLTIDPSESVSFTISWDMTDLDGNPTGSGEYEVTAALGQLDPFYQDKYVPVSATITIIPSTILVPDDYPTIQQAIDDAVDGDVVIVADGTYTGDGNRDIDFLGKAITVRSESGPENCIIDCQTLGIAFYFHTGEGADSLLDGFTLINGRAGVGAIYCSSASPTVANCVITNSAGRIAGGGLCFRGSSPTVTDCTIKGNFAERGGAIYCDNNSSPTIANCNIIQNSAERYGGGIHARDSSLTMINCTLTGNSAIYFGGAIDIIDSNLTISGCTFTGNSAEDGGAVYNRESAVTIDACTFKRNRSESSGGALYNKRGTQRVTNSLFTGNSATYGGAIMNPPDRLINCTFTGNSAYAGGAINSSHVHLYSFNDEPGQPPDTPIENCILWGDTPDEIHDYCWHPGNADAVWSDVRFSNVQGGCPGEGNIDADPCFVDPGYWADACDPNIIVGPNDPNAIWVDGDYHLLAGSPCIDAGDPNYIPEPNETDLDGEPRVIAGRVDMGAYEYTPPLAAQVRISPNTLNLRSKGRWLTCYILLPEDCSAADIDPNSILLEDEITPDKVVSYGRLAVAKFSRSALQQLLSDLQTPAEVELLVSGQLTDGTPFEGTDTIRVIGKGHLRGRRINSNSKVVDGIEYYIQTDKAVYSLGENVQMLYRVTNLGDEEVSMWFPHSPVYNFWVAKDAENVWTAVEGWWTVITTLVLTPGESKEFPDYYPPQIWDMSDRDGNLVSPGKYTVIGGLYDGSGLWDFTRVSVNIRIISDHVVRKEVNTKPDIPTLINTPGHRKQKSTSTPATPKPKKHGKSK